MNLHNLLTDIQIVIAYYAIIYLTIYLLFGYFSFKAIKKYFNSKNYLSKELLLNSDYITGVSIIAPAYNECKTVVYNVKSLLKQNYKNYEVILVNDGSTDNTLELLIDKFSLVKVDFFYNEQIKTEPIKGHYKSSNPEYAKLLVVDKFNGGSKADASNAGINSSKYPLFICTDVDCILRKDTIALLVRPFISGRTKTIATGGAIRIANSCKIENGELVESHFPKEFFPKFQELEYIRAFLYGRMAWSQINGLLLISGGLGMFDKEIAIEAGGYKHDSLAEDLDLVIRMRMLLHERNEKFSVRYSPETLCWTEVPNNSKYFIRQRVRWARGLFQTILLHKKLFFNPKYGITGLLSFPYFVLYEFFIPIISIIGFIAFLLSVLLYDINEEFYIYVTTFVYLFYTFITLAAVYVDQQFYRHYSNVKELFSLILNVLVEPFIFHPFQTFASLKGYVLHLTGKKSTWGEMDRSGFNSKLKES